LEEQREQNAQLQQDNETSVTKIWQKELEIEKDKIVSVVNILLYFIYIYIIYTVGHRERKKIFTLKLKVNCFQNSGLKISSPKFVSYIKYFSLLGIAKCCFLN
jgi:hypothetical protein